MKEILKRIFDIISSCIGLIFLLPVIFLAAIFIRLDSEGNPFFLQTRVGRNGKLFKIIKLRTMYIKQDHNKVRVTSNNDPRITKIGAIFRKYKLDELPQLINVLIGDMSIVGPRPEVPEYLARYPKIARKRLLSVKPGITDLASLHLSDQGAMLAESDNPERDYFAKIIPRKLAYGRIYIKNNSLCYDIVLILKTIKKIIGSNN